MTVPITFETECQEGLKQYGPSKEHRPSPIVEMGLSLIEVGSPLPFVSIQAIPINRLL